MSETGIVYKSVAELSRLIESKQVSPVEVAEAYLSRIDELDFKFNSYLTVCRQEVLEQALEAEAAITKGGYLGPMHGIPEVSKTNSGPKMFERPAGPGFW